MKLHAIQKAIVPKTKITDYLLCLTHTNGQSKARFFLNHGFCIECWQELAEALRDLAQLNEVINVENTPFGMRYVIDGKTNTPNQRNPFIRTVWFIEHEQTIPIFVTAYHNRNNIMIKELDTVVLDVDLPEYHLEKNDIGTVVLVHQNYKGYEVEFITLEGETLVVILLFPSQIRTVQKREIPHVRLVA